MANPNCKCCGGGGMVGRVQPDGLKLVGWSACPLCLPHVYFEEDENDGEG